MPFLRHRRLVVVVQMLMALLAATVSAVGCEHCWHQMAASSPDNTQWIEGVNVEGSVDAHACVCCCQSTATLDSEPQFALIPISDRPYKFAIAYQPATISPPLLPPRL